MNKYCVIGGSNVHNSMSPVIHNYWLKKCCVQGVTYEALSINGDDFNNEITRMKANDELCGFNVTSPYKVQIQSHLDEISEIALAVGAVNTVYCENGVWCGDNSDVYGFNMTLSQKKKSDTVQNCLVCGAGGAARAVLYALSHLKVGSIVVCVRGKNARLELLKQDFPSIDVQFYPDVKDKVQCFDLVVNSTSVNFSSLGLQVDSNKLLDLNYFHASDRVDGLYMLLYQAKLAFNNWHNTSVTVDEKLFGFVSSELNI